MTASDLIIFAIVQKGHYTLLKPELVDFFEGVQHTLYGTAFMCKLSKVDPTPEIMKNYIHQDDSLSDKNKDICLIHLNEILSKDRYFDILDLEDNVRSEWTHMRMVEINTVTVNPLATTEMKKDIIMKTAEVFKGSKKIDDFQRVKTILGTMEQDEKRLPIKIQDENLINIFGEYIYPQMYSILARPGDFKTTLLLELILEFNRLGKKGILISLEDSSRMASSKLMSLHSAIAKKDIILGQYDKQKYDTSLETFNDNIWIMDRIRTPDELFQDLHNKLSVGDFKWIAIDYLQIIKGMKRMSEYEKISLLDANLLQLNKEFGIHVHRLTQSTKEKISGQGFLGIGDEKGSGEISHNSRYSISINKGVDDISDHQTERIIDVYKTSFRAKGQIKVTFEGKTGRILNTEKIQVNKGA